MKDKTFSIIIANYNYKEFVQEAIDSCLKQDYPEELYEVVVVDDESDDGSIEVLKELSLAKEFQFVTKKNGGQISAFREGLHYCKNEFICLLDADDLFERNKLTTVNEFLKLYSGLPDDFILCHDLNIELIESQQFLNYSWFESNFIGLFEPEFKPLKEVAHPYPFATPCGQIYSRKLFEKLMNELSKLEIKSAFDDPMPQGGLLMSGGVHYLYEKLATYRIHQNNNFLGVVNNQIKPKFQIADRLGVLQSFLQQIASTDEEKNYVDSLSEVIQKI
jgi:glycosyltransferase involved in cell wall biosynthesis